LRTLFMSGRLTSTFRARMLLGIGGVNLNFLCSLRLGVLANEREWKHSLPSDDSFKPCFTLAGLRVLVKPHFRRRDGLDRIENELGPQIAVDVDMLLRRSKRLQRDSLFLRLAGRTLVTSSKS